MGCGASGPVVVSSSPTGQATTAGAAAATAGLKPNSASRGGSVRAPTSAVDLPTLSTFMKGLSQRGFVSAEKPAISTMQQGGLLGVSVALLQAIRELVGPHASSQQVFDTLLLPAVRSAGASRFADLLAPCHVGRPRFFLSHTHATPLADTVAAAHDALALRADTSVQHHQPRGVAAAAGTAAGDGADSVGQEVVWVDVLCSTAAAAPKQGSSGGAAAVAEVCDVVRGTEATLLVLDAAGAALSRLWVLSEVVATGASDSSGLLDGGGLVLAGPPDPPLPPAPLPPDSRVSSDPEAPSLAHTLEVLTWVAGRGGDGYVGGDLGEEGDRVHLTAALARWLKLGEGQAPGEGEVGTALTHAVAAALRGAALKQAATLLAAWPNVAVGEQPAARLSAPGVGGTGRGSGEERASYPPTSGSRMSAPGGPPLPGARASAPAPLAHIPEDAAVGGAGGRQGAASGLGALWAKGAPPDPAAVGMLRAASALARCGAVLHALGEEEEAEGPLRRALQLRGRVLGGEAGPTAATYVALGRLLADGGDGARAEPLLRRGIAHLKRVGGKDHGEVGDALGVLGVVLLGAGKTSEAAAALTTALKVQRGARGGGHARTATTAANLASALRGMGRMEEAAGLYRTVLEVHTTTLGAAHPHTATVAGNLAYVLQCTGQAADALPFARQALAGMRVAYGTTHASTAAALANLGSVLRDCGKLGEAHTALQEALDVLIGALGEIHPDTATARRHLADLERAMQSSKGGGGCTAGQLRG